MPRSIRSFRYSIVGLFSSEFRNPQSEFRNLYPLLQFFLFAEEPRWFDDKNNKNGNKAYNHHPVRTDVGSCKGLGISYQHTGNKNPSGAAQTSHNADGKSIEQGAIAPFHRHLSQRKNRNSSPASQSGAKG